MANDFYKLKRFIPLLSMACFFIGCRGSIQDFIPGTYTTEWTTAFTEGRDTVSIIPSSHGSHYYQLTRRTYMLYQNKPQYKLTHWTGVFNHADNSIRIDNNGRVLYFDNKRHTLTMGVTVYKKL